MQLYFVLTGKRTYVRASMEVDSLMCDEELPATPPAGAASFSSSSTSSGVVVEQPWSCTWQGRCHARLDVAAIADDEERSRALSFCLLKTSFHMPVEGYADRLRGSARLAELRYRAVRWIMTARSQLGLSLATAFLAVNYFDRFASRYHDMNWECWMTELLSIACLSIAVKFEEVAFITLHAYPMDDMENAYEPSTIQRMEMLVLNALDWRVKCVTSYSYVDLLTWRIDSYVHKHIAGAFDARVTEFLISSLLDVQNTSFTPFSVAVAAVKCAHEELAAAKSSEFLSSLESLIPEESKEEVESCYRIMEQRVGDPLYTSMAKWNYQYPPSPVTVIRRVRQQPEIPDKDVDLDIFFSPRRHSSDGCAKNNKRTRKIQ